MPRVSPIETLPESVKNELKNRLEASGYGDLSKHSAWLKKVGYSISKSSIGRYAQSAKGRTKIAKEFAARIGVMSTDARLGSEEVVELLIELGTLEVRKYAIAARLGELKFKPD